MSRAGAYDPAPATVERIETHASFVFLAGDFAYKIKRSVKLPFLDFSTLEKRHKACLNELRLNRRTAPEVYLEVVPLARDAGGTLSLRGDGETVEWVLVMRRFGQEHLYDRMAREGRLSIVAMGETALEIAALHRSADRILTIDQAVLPLEKIIAEHEDVLKGCVPGIVPQDLAEDLVRRTRSAFERLGPLLKRRARTGFVRHCHGDLHLRNIVEIDGRPVLFDALEFNDSLATIDVLYDLAFLLMDLGKHGLGVHANAVLNSYLDDGGTGNLAGLAALPLFLSLRAVIRGKVELLRAKLTALSDANSAQEEARDYLRLALRFLDPDSPRSLPWVAFRGAENRPLRVRSRRGSERFPVRSLCGATRSANGCSAWPPPRGYPKEPTHKRSRTSCMPCAESGRHLCSKPADRSSWMRSMRGPQSARRLPPSHKITAPHSPGSGSMHRPRS